MQEADNRLVTVCSECLTASCWNGEFYCDKYISAGTVEKTVDELRELKLEHESYYLPYARSRGQQPKEDTDETR